MIDLKITKHAIDRYIERVLNITDIKSVSNSKRDIIKVGLKKLNIFHNELSCKDGYYLLNNKTYCLILTSTIVTVIVKANSASSFFNVAKDIKEKFKINKWVFENKSYLRGKVKKRNTLKSKIYYGETHKETLNIERLLKIANNKEVNRTNPILPLNKKIPNRVINNNLTIVKPIATKTIPFKIKKNNGNEKTLFLSSVKTIDEKVNIINRNGYGDKLNKMIKTIEKRFTQRDIEVNTKQSISLEYILYLKDLFEKNLISYTEGARKSFLTYLDKTIMLFNTEVKKHNAYVSILSAA